MAIVSYPTAKSFAMMPKDGMNILKVMAGKAVNKVRIIIIFGAEDWVIGLFNNITYVDTYTKITSAVHLKIKCHTKVDK